ncbi:MAG: hypothetical protein ABI921_06455 [Panacibacter sp.]
MKQFSQTNELNYTSVTQVNFKQKLMPVHKPAWNEVFFFSYVLCMMLTGCSLGILFTELLKWL